jgi:hypothetical protein
MNFYTTIYALPLRNYVDIAYFTPLLILASLRHTILIFKSSASSFYALYCTFQTYHAMFTKPSTRYYTLHKFCLLLHADLNHRNIYPLILCMHILQSRGLCYMQFKNPSSHIARTTCLLKTLLVITVSATLLTLVSIGRSGLPVSYGSRGLPIALPYIYMVRGTIS